MKLPTKEVKAAQVELIHTTNKCLGQLKFIAHVGRDWMDVIMVSAYVCDRCGECVTSADVDDYEFDIML